MLCYILHKTPIWRGIPEGKRNVRILCLALVIYLFLHAIVFEYKENNFLAKILYGYFIYFIAADVFLCGIEYKLYYGRSIINELSPYEKDIYDETSHTYIPNNFDTNIENDEFIFNGSDNLIDEPIVSNEDIMDDYDNINNDQANQANQDETNNNNDN